MDKKPNFRDLSLNSKLDKYSWFANIKLAMEPKEKSKGRSGHFCLIGILIEFTYVN